MDSKEVPVIFKFLFGSISGAFAESITFPLFIIKTVMQTSGVGSRNKGYKTSFDVFHSIIKGEGFISFYSGLGPAIAKHKMFSGIKIGVYQTLVDYHHKQFDTSPPFRVKVLYATTSGALAGFFSHPYDLVRIRILTSPAEERMRFRGVYRTFWEIRKKDGIRGVFKAAPVTVLRASVAAITKFVAYSEAKEYLIKNDLIGDKVACHMLCSLAATLCMCFLYLPFDAVKVRLQYFYDFESIPQCNSGSVDCFMKIVRQEGYLALWKGFTPAVVCYGFYNIIFFLTMENLLRMHKEVPYSQRKIDDDEFFEIGP
ncbi:mitochondrial 2-oxoglutarate/malate carrier protein-like [Agrilus planipennis]|uniref:Mitochondrial 2-oxoglutarate/malate carrier protein-like n=1 Tax=Agrilus planipennis TaxID=224129 RepID=A0A1W4WFS3_AGRPL|nr:mitochondrial 2-oxoglutarate/malate carrier protein-like [Agrilus planipennis]